MKSHSLPITAALPGFNNLQLPILWVKELRVILPTVLGCGFLLLLSVALPPEFRSSIVFLVYPLTCSAVFALAFGHDYMHRTLTTALAQPVSRHKVLRTRLALCLLALLPLAVIQIVAIERIIWAAFFDGFETVSLYLANMAYQVWVRSFEPILTAICLAPCLTLLSRSVLFGTIVSMTAPFALGVLVRAVALKIGFEDGPRLVTLHLAASCTLLLTGAVLTYRRFITQEAIETDVTIGRKRAPKSNALSQSAMGNPHCEIQNPLWQLVKKEAMLQRLPAAIAALSVAVVFLVNKDHAAMLSIFYPATIIILIGAIASAEERRMGVIPSQVAHPIAFKTQWLIKIAVSYFSALLFGVILPGAALLLKTDELKALTPNEALADAPLICGGVLLILSITIYISSLSQNAIRAMLATLFVMIISIMLVGAAYNAFTQYIWETTSTHIVFSSPPAGNRTFDVINIEFQLECFAIAALGFIPLALYFAMQNHRYLDRSGR
ncbi:MAG TPA: hypothetical protein VM680_10440 [Verrucomicrobiae bacterium]|nr:hypothetical protein [Verrucomicrobiae bacterium]